MLMTLQQTFNLFYMRRRLNSINDGWYSMDHIVLPSMTGPMIYNALSPIVRDLSWRFVIDSKLNFFVEYMQNSHSQHAIGFYKRGAWNCSDYTVMNLFAVDHLCGCDHAINTSVHDRHHGTLNVRRWFNELLHLADSLLIHVLQLLHTNKTISHSAGEFTAHMAVWHSGSVVPRMNEVALHWAR